MAFAVPLLLAALLSFARADPSCSFEQGNVLQDQLCSDDPLYAEIANLSKADCARYAATGRRGSGAVPQFVVDGAKCLFEVTGGGTLPNWIKLMYGGENPCVVELAYEAARNEYTNYSDLRSEHISYHLLVDNDPSSRLTLSNNDARMVVPNTKGFSVQRLFEEDIRLHGLELRAQEGSSKRKYVAFLWHHIVTYAAEVLVFQGSGARSLLEAVAAFSRKSYWRMKLDFELCRWWQGGWSFREAFPRSTSAEALEAAMRTKTSPAQFERWQRWKALLQSHRAPDR